MSFKCSLEERCTECWPDEPWKKKAGSSDVHATSFASECDVQLLCTAEWTFPCSVTADPDVLLSEDYFKYTKDKTKVGCKKCLKKMKL